MNWTIVAGASAIASHGLIILITWLVTRSLVNTMRTPAVGGSVGTVLARNGGVYFMLLLLANVIGLIVGRQTEIAEGISTILIILTSIVMSRFIFDLRRATDTNSTDLSGEFTLQTIVFARSPGNIADAQLEIDEAIATDEGEQ